MNGYKTKLYYVWVRIKQRCFNKNCSDYKYWGARGIKVCDEWKTSYEAFQSWAVANGYKEGLHIERINNDGDYAPRNCKWATPIEQANNKRNNHNITYKGKTQTVAQWARELDVSPYFLFDRLNKLHWSVEKAFTKPKQYA